LGSSGARSPITPKPCASSTYSTASYRRASRANSFRSGALPVMLFTPSMQISRVLERSRRRSCSRSSGSSNLKRFTLAPRADANWQPS
jgi:hypothetical protein